MTAPSGGRERWPNPRLQRTRMRAPLSPKPFCGGTRISNRREVLKMLSTLCRLVACRASFALGLLCASLSCADPAPPTPRGVEVTRAQYGDQWPFTVESGFVDCEPPGSAIFRTRLGTHGLNGLAKSRGVPDVRPIWRDDPNNPGLKVNIGAMIDLALDQCAQR